MRLTTSDVLGVIQVGLKSDYSPATLQTQLAGTFPNLEIENLPPLIDAFEAYDSIRDQYHSTRLLALLEKHIETFRVDRLLGISAFDLYVPGMNFVFGEARCPGRVAVISTWRLKEAPGKLQVFGTRVLKEAVHEIGHMFGLKHCPEKTCVMHFSEHIGDTDMKNSTFCANCKSSLGRLKIGEEIQS